MVINAEKIGALLTKGQDPLITRLGGFLRRTKLDELPQLWNALVGEMSFVGPRPEVQKYVALYTPAQREILKYKPGLTDVATLLFRNEELLLNGTEDIEGFYLAVLVVYALGLTFSFWLAYQLHADFRASGQDYAGFKH